MTDQKSIKLEVDTKTIEALAALCELSGIDIEEVITFDTIERTHKRLKEVLLSLKNTHEDSNKEIENLKHQIKELKKNLQDPNRPPTSNNQPEQVNNDSDTDTETVRRPEKLQNILIIANLGVIMHQLKIIFSKFGCKVTLVRNYTEAIQELKQLSYDCILFDLPSLAEPDLMQLEGLKKALEICHSRCIIVTLILPTKEKKLLKALKTKGADIIIEKLESWHMSILQELNLSH